ncbi:MAG: LamG domain-containing protein [Cyclobacteriaceae bacterium]|nr:LamG domain-containing protein [Cyclobacteriaceae bacterium]
MFTILSVFWTLQSISAQDVKIKPDKKLIRAITSSRGFVALWKFDEQPGTPRLATGKSSFPLQEVQGNIARINEGPLSGYSIMLDGSNYLMLPNASTGPLNIHGSGSEVTVIAFVKWTGEQTGFVGGMWNEYQDGGKRQYGLFISLPHYNGRDQVCGHISKSGKPTPPFPYSIDYSASQQIVPANEWSCVAFTYDGTYIRSYFNGEFVERESELIRNTKGFEGYPEGLIQSKNPYYFPDGMGNNGSDFTVGAVLLQRGMGNFFKGLIGGLAVFDRALDDDELKKISDRMVK